MTQAIPPATVALLLLLLLAISTLHPVSSAAINPTPPSRPAASHKLPQEPEWTFSQAPDYCQALVARPTWLTRECRMNHQTMRCKNGQFQMFSQMKQDYYLYTQHFKHLKRRGIYLDVAANDPIAISNTFFFEKCLGWSGLCVEANPHYLAKLHRHRNCAITPTCVSDRDRKKVKFVLKDALSGVLETNKNMWKWENESVPTVTQLCSTLGLEAERYAIKRADYLSLDVEGHEIEVLNGIDFDNLIINVITVEPNAHTIKQIEHLLTSKGYVRHTPTLDDDSKRSRTLGGDLVFLYHDVVFGRPE